MPFNPSVDSGGAIWLFLARNLLFPSLFTVVGSAFANQIAVLIQHFKELLGKHRLSTESLQTNKAGARVYVSTWAAEGSVCLKVGQPCNILRCTASTLWKALKVTFKGSVEGVLRAYSKWSIWFCKGEYIWQTRPVPDWLALHHHSSHSASASRAQKVKSAFHVLATVLLLRLPEQL